MRYQGRCEQIWENGCLLASWSKSHANLFLCIFPSHQHEFTGFLSCAHHLLCESGETQESMVTLLEEFDGSASRTH